MIEKVTAAICETTNCPAEAVSIIIREMEKENYAHAGVLQCDK